VPHISLHNVSKVYPAVGNASHAVVALDSVSLDIASGEAWGILGYSGAGKSTLLRLINALEKPTSGTIFVNGRDLTALRERDLRRVRTGIGMIFQEFNLFSAKTVWGNIAYPLVVAGAASNEIAGRVKELLGFVGLSDKAKNYPEQLSGGQKQRVGIARALATSPRILLADEATSALDPDTTQEILALLKRVNEDFGVTVIAITHEMDVVQALATQVAVMDKGRIIEHGNIFDVFSHPRPPASQRFVATVVKGVPSSEDLHVLRQRHDGRIVTLSFRQGDVSQGQIFLHLARAGVEFELIYGGINDIGGRVFGHLTFALRGTVTAVEGALEKVRTLVDVSEDSGT
jgi:D-methionine transport system ATP-binding protein